VKNCLLRCPPGKQERIVPHLPSTAQARFNRPGDEVLDRCRLPAVLSSSREEQASLVNSL
jgi:hypothetical protein